MEILFALVFLFAAGYTVKHGVPKVFRKARDGRRAAIDSWQADHPTGPKSARVAAKAARTATAVRWGPRYVKQGFGEAWREGWDKGKRKYRPDLFVEPEPRRNADGDLVFSKDPKDPNGSKRCPQCRGEVVVDGLPCPACHERQKQRSADWEQRHPSPLCTGCGGKAVVDGVPCAKCRRQQAEGERKWDAPPQPTHRGDPACTTCHGGGWKYNQPCPDCNGGPPLPKEEQPHPAPKPQPEPSPTPTTTSGDDMAIDTANGGEIHHAEQFLAEAQAVLREAAVDREDAAADNGRAEEDMARIERMVASLAKESAVADDIAAVAALKEPSAQRAAAAKDRLSAAERRLAVAKNVVTIAARHYQLIGKAVGSFYNRQS